jgi:hypothetical protein
MVDFTALDDRELRAMHAAAEEILTCYRVLERTDTNIVAEVLAGGGAFYEYDHYPDGDVYDRVTHAQYYYHAHREESGEHGHFHTFIRREGIPKAIRPVRLHPASPQGDTICHLVAISMDAYGFPTGLFTTNRWVTDETWYKAPDVIALLDRFLIDHTFPNWAVNRWIGAMLRLFRPQIEDLLHARDAAIEDWRARRGAGDVFEDRALDITSQIAISVDDQMAQIKAALG